jgi:hypothetical protein
MRVLFSPLGLSKGSLFTAIVKTRPDHVVVITSEEGAKLVDEIVAQAKSLLNKSFTFEVHTVSDPFTSFVSGRKLAKALAMRKVPILGIPQGGSSENIVNLAGGTTALQDAVQYIARLLDAKEIAVIDRRPYGEQQANPYVVGEIIEIPAGIF